MPVPPQRGFRKQKQTAKKGNKMPAKKKSAKSVKKMRDLKPSKDARGGTGPGIKPGFQGGKKKNLY
jgi:hypothetical protein